MTATAAGATNMGRVKARTRLTDPVRGFRRKRAPAENSFSSGFAVWSMMRTLPSRSRARQTGSTKTDGAARMDTLFVTGSIRKTQPFRFPQSPGSVSRSSRRTVPVSSSIRRSTGRRKRALAPARRIGRLGFLAGSASKSAPKEPPRPSGSAEASATKRLRFGAETTATGSLRLDPAVANPVILEFDRIQTHPVRLPKEKASASASTRRIWRTVGTVASAGPPEAPRRRPSARRRPNCAARWKNGRPGNGSSQPGLRTPLLLVLSADTM